MKRIILLSGGIDSVVCLSLYCGDEILCVGFDYGQPHVCELERAEKFARVYDVHYERITLPTMPKINDVVFAARNAVFLSMGAAVAESYGYDQVVIGCNQSDWERFPDCRPDFLKHMNIVLKDTYGVAVAAPLCRRSKAEVIQMARKLLININDCWTCYSPKDGEPCEECYSCCGRKAAGG